MSGLIRNVFSCCIFLLPLSFSASAADSKPRLPDGAGKEVTQKLCGSCHAAEIVMSRRESREGWSGVVEDMILRGLQGTDEEYGEVVDYLVTAFPKGAAVPKVNVNKAEATDLIAGVGLTNAQAAAIVKYRTENGNFKSAEDLQKVPGLKPSVIEAKKSRLEF